MNANIMKTQIDPKLKHELKGHERPYKAKFFLTLKAFNFEKGHVKQVLCYGEGT